MNNDKSRPADNPEIRSRLALSPIQEKSPFIPDPESLAPLAPLSPHLHTPSSSQDAWGSASASSDRTFRTHNMSSELSLADLNDLQSIHDSHPSRARASSSLLNSPSSLAKPSPIPGPLSSPSASPGAAAAAAAAAASPPTAQGPRCGLASAGSSPVLYRRCSALSPGALPLSRKVHSVPYGLEEAGASPAAQPGAGQARGRAAALSPELQERIEGFQSPGGGQGPLRHSPGLGVFRGRRHKHFSPMDLGPGPAAFAAVSRGGAAGFGPGTSPQHRQAGHGRHMHPQSPYACGPGLKPFPGGGGGRTSSEGLVTCHPSTSPQRHGGAEDPELEFDVQGGGGGGGGGAGVGHGGAWHGTGSRGRARESFFSSTGSAPAAGVSEMLSRVKPLLDRELSRQTSAQISPRITPFISAAQTPKSTFHNVFLPLSEAKFDKNRSDAGAASGAGGAGGFDEAEAAAGTVGSGGAGGVSPGDGGAVGLSAAQFLSLADLSLAGSIKNLDCSGPSGMGQSGQGGDSGTFEAPDSDLDAWGFQAGGMGLPSASFADLIGAAGAAQLGPGPGYNCSPGPFVGAAPLPVPEPQALGPWPQPLQLPPSQGPPPPDAEPRPAEAGPSLAEPSQQPSAPSSPRRAQGPERSPPLTPIRIRSGSIQGSGAGGTSYQDRFLVSIASPSCSAVEAEAAHGNPGPSKLFARPPALVIETLQLPRGEGFGSPPGSPVAGSPPTSGSLSDYASAATRGRGLGSGYSSRQGSPGSPRIPVPGGTWKPRGGAQAPVRLSGAGAASASPQGQAILAPRSPKLSPRIGPRGGTGTSLGTGTSPATTGSLLGAAENASAASQAQTPTGSPPQSDATGEYDSEGAGPQPSPEMTELASLLRRFGVEVLDPRDLTKEKFVGAGSFGSVYRGNLSGVVINMESAQVFGHPVALKFPRDRRVFDTYLPPNQGPGKGAAAAAAAAAASDAAEAGEAMNSALVEAFLLGRLRHPNVVLSYGLVLPTPRQMPVQRGTVHGPALVSEFCEEGSLSDLLRSPQPLSSWDKVKLALDCAQGMRYLHSRHCLHLDLKSGNLLIERELYRPPSFGSGPAGSSGPGGEPRHVIKAKVADFGLSTLLSGGRRHVSLQGSSMLGTVPWSAPENFVLPGDLTAALSPAEKAAEKESKARERGKGTPPMPADRAGVAGPSDARGAGGGEEGLAESGPGPSSVAELGRGEAEEAPGRAAGSVASGFHRLASIRLGSQVKFMDAMGSLDEEGGAGPSSNSPVLPEGPPAPEHHLGSGPDQAPHGEIKAPADPGPGHGGDAMPGGAGGRRRRDRDRPGRRGSLEKEGSRGGERRIGYKADVFSFGILMWELWTRRVPYGHLLDSSPISIMVYVIRGGRPPIPGTRAYSLAYPEAATATRAPQPPPPEPVPGWQSLMERCWEGSPAARPSFEELTARLEEMLVVAEVARSWEKKGG